ncbi:MAG TPA: alpha/beta hydrolase [Rhodopila sp.]|nr:alpha/beta hydrolase [Rhodopila sp.]
MTACLLAFALLFIAPVSPAAATDTVPVPVLNWQPCPSSLQAGFQCATAQVPIDYAAPKAGSFALALIKHPAQDQANRIGTLFWNPGGPSDAGTQYLPAAINGFPQQVRSRFDIISWDPRGMGGGTRPVVQCFDSEAQETQAMDQLLGGIPNIPTSSADLVRLFKARETLNQDCVSHAGSLLAHVSTADNALDLDLLRQAVGEAKINYYGTSYGTFLGATYLNLFPQSVRAAVLDGAVAPTAWAANGNDDPRLSTFVRVGSDFGASDTMTAFMLACGTAGTSGCAFADQTPDATVQKWHTLLDRLQANPVTIDGQSIDDTGVIAYFQSSIYTIHPVPGFGRFPGYVAVAEFLQTVRQASDAGGQASAGVTSASSTQASATITAPAASTTYITSYGRQAAVICGESPNPETVSGYVRQARKSFRRAGLSPWPFAAICLGWSAKAANPYFGPWKAPTPPVLVVGNTFDPATPYASSQRMARELFNGHFLTVDGFGHTELLNTSRCAQDYIAAYLINGTLPPEGARCAQDYAPFSQ